MVGNDIAIGISSSWQSISLSSRFTLTPNASIDGMLLSLHERCRTGRETVQLCKNNITFLTCVPSVIHKTRLSFIKTYYTARVLIVISIPVIKIIMNKKLQGSVFRAKSTAAPLFIEFNNFYILWLSITVLYTVTVLYSFIYHECPLVLYTVTVHYSVHHALWPVHLPPHITISYVWTKAIISCRFFIKLPNQNIAFILITLACYTLQKKHYDATQYATYSYTILLKSKYFTQLPFSNTLSLQLFPLWDIVFHGHTKVNKHSRLYFNYHVSYSI